MGGFSNLDIANRNAHEGIYVAPEKTATGALTLEALREALGGTIENSEKGPHLRTRGPGHGIGNDSLIVWLDARKKYGFGFKSFANDSYDDCVEHILGCLDIEVTRREIVATYDYRDETGNVLFQVVRYEPKAFSQRRPDGNGGWKKGGIGDVRRVLYRLPEIIKAVAAGEIILIAEGEKDVENLVKLGFAATTSPGGASEKKRGRATADHKWRPEFSDTLAGADVLLIPDNDKAGAGHVQNVAEQLLGVAKRVRILTLPGLDGVKKGDASDWIAKGGTADQLRKLIDQAPDATADGRPIIQIEAGEMEAAVNAVEDALIASDRALYQRGGRIVGVGRATLRTCGGGAETIPVVEERGDHALAEDIAAAARLMRYDRREKDWVKVDVPSNIVLTLQERGTRLRFPQLAGFISAPTLRPDGSILDQPGYDEETGLLLDTLGVDFPIVAENPTRDEAAAALRTLRDLFKDFPWIGEDDEAVALSALLTACNRKSIPTAPMHAISAPAAGSGKSLIVNVASIIATGHSAVAIAPGHDEEELSKQLAAALFEGASIISFDNAEMVLGGALLNRALTEAVVKPRRLGKSESPSIVNDFFILATGNNLTVTRDMVRRTLLCRIDPKAERPETREFDRDLIAYTKAHRPRLLVAALTILRAYVVAGKPKPEKAAPLGNYEVWSDWNRAALLWLGCADPVATMAKVREDDPALAELSAVLETWANVLRDKGVTAAEAIAEANKGTTTTAGDGSDPRWSPTNPEFRQALMVVGTENGRLNPRRLGQWLRKNADKLCGKYRITRTGDRHGMAVWRLDGYEGWSAE